MNYLLMSDPHLHAWSAFASVDKDGVNTRLRIIANEILRALSAHEKAGGDKKLVFGGDVFHTRGSVQTSTLNFVIDLFERIAVGHGYEIYILTGNHDLESKDSMRLASSVTALEPFCKAVINERIVDTDIGLAFIPWFQNVDDLKEEIDCINPSIRENLDLIIHAPIDGVIPGLPDHGLSADYLGSLGFKRVFAGHYHSHKDFGNGVFSIGATTYQTFSDIGSKAGFLTVFPDRVQFHASHAPKFVDINVDNFDEAAMIVDGNYVRCNIVVSKESEVEALREQFFEWGAKGVIINQIKNTTASDRGVITASPTGAMSLSQSVIEFSRSKGYGELVEKMCLEILEETAEVEA